LTPCRDTRRQDARFPRLQGANLVCGTEEALLTKLIRLHLSAAASGNFTHSGLEELYYSDGDPAFIVTK
jgi:hypothetical protein